MKSTVALVVALLAANTLAMPTSFPCITVSVINDVNGSNAQATVLANGVPNSIPDLFRHSNIDDHGSIFATSAQLVQFVENAFCSFNEDDHIFPINGRSTFLDLDGDADKATAILLNHFTFQCQI